MRRSCSRILGRLGEVACSVHFSRSRRILNFELELVVAVGAGLMRVMGDEMMLDEGDELRLVMEDGLSKGEVGFADGDDDGSIADAGCLINGSCSADGGNGSTVLIARLPACLRAFVVRFFTFSSLTTRSFAHSPAPDLAE